MDRFSADELQIYHFLLFSLRNEYALENRAFKAGKTEGRKFVIFFPLTARKA